MLLFLGSGLDLAFGSDPIISYLSLWFLQGKVLLKHRFCIAFSYVNRLTPFLASMMLLQGRLLLKH